MCDLIFGITGQTGAGKTMVSDIFRNLGVTVVDADEASKETTKKGSPCLKEIEKCFGSEFILPSGELDRRGLGRVVFSNPDKLAKLSEITHKYIKESVTQKLSESTSKIKAIDGAVLIGSNMEEMCAFMVAVTADCDIRKERIKLRDGLSDEDAKTRINAQQSKEFYKNHAKYIIENNKTQKELEQQTIEVYNQICKYRKDREFE